LRPRVTDRRCRHPAGGVAALGPRCPEVPVLSARDMRGRAWRWHFLAALLVSPFVLWQSDTGTLYLWSEHWVDHRHGELRVVEAVGQRVLLDAQVQAARDHHAGRAVGSILFTADPLRSKNGRAHV